MTLVRDTGEYASWLVRATRRLAQVNRRAALRLILSMSVNQVVTFLVFFLPLKVVLLVASDGVSRYFKFFISQESKNAWIGGLVVAIIILYAVSIHLEAVADRNASRGAKSLISSAEQVPITSDPEDFARTTFYRIGETVGGLIFGLLTLVAGTLVFPAFFLAIPVLLGVEFGVVALALGEDPPDRLKRLGSYVAEKPQELFRWLRQVNFLVAFSVLIVLFLIVDGLNPLLGIAAVLLSRRLFGALKNVARDSIKLSWNRRLVDALLFPEARVAENVPAERERLLFNAVPSVRHDRLQRFVEAEGAGNDLETYTNNSTSLTLLQSVEESIWIDSGHTMAATFDLYGAGTRGTRRRLFREYVYAGKASRGIEQQDYLFRFLDADELRSPERVLGYQYDGLVGRIVDFREMREISQGEWGTCRQEVLEHLWSLALPGSLVDAYDSAHPRLHERAPGELLEPLKVARDEPWAKSTYDVLMAKLPELCDRVAELPLTLFNERLSRRNVVIDGGGESRILDWTSWTLHPVGAGLHPDTDSWSLVELAGKYAARRARESSGTLEKEALIAALLQRMERLVQTGYPKTALGLAFPFLEFVQDVDRTCLEEFTLERESEGAGGIGTEMGR